MYWFCSWVVFNTKTSRNREWMWCCTVLCLQCALNITTGPLDGITHPSHLCEIEILHRLTVWILLHLWCLYVQHTFTKKKRKSRFGTKQKIRCANLRGYWVGTEKCLSSHMDSSSSPIGHMPSNSKICPCGQMGEAFRCAPEQAEIRQVMASQANLRIKAHSKSRLVAVAHGQRLGIRYRIYSLC